MLRAIGLAVALAGLFFAGEALGQITFHADNQGYTQRLGGMTIVNRNDGYNSMSIRTGNLETFNNNRGTFGSSYYGSVGRFDSYSGQGWSGSGFSPYSGPAQSTYQRTYFNPPAYAPPAYTPPVYTPPAFQPYRSPYGW